MLKINLLPYRKARQEALLKRFYVFLGVSAGIGAALIVVAHIFMTIQISNQETRNAYLKSETDNLEKQIKDINKLKSDTAVMLARKRVVEDLQANRSRIVMLLNHISQSGEGIELTKMAHAPNGTITFDGIANSNPHVSLFLKHLEGSDILSGATIISSEAFSKAPNTKSNSVKFVITATLLNLSQKKKGAVALNRSTETKTHIPAAIPAPPAPAATLPTAPIPQATPATPAVAPPPPAKPAAQAALAAPTTTTK